jgi:hypothetical protein
MLLVIHVLKDLVIIMMQHEDCSAPANLPPMICLGPGLPDAHNRGLATTLMICEIVRLSLRYEKWASREYALSRRQTLIKQPVGSAYQPPASSTFLSEQTSHQQPASNTFLSEQISTSHQPPANRTG